MDFGFVLVNAITLAWIYGTLAIGISITWSSLGLINMAYGFIFAFSSFGAWLTGQWISQHGVVVMGAGILTGALGGLLVCLVAFIPLHDKPNFTVRGMIATLAVSLVGTQALLWLRSSRRGLEIRAMMMNPAAAALVGIGVRRTRLYVLALTGGLAGLAAVLLAQTYDVSPFGGVTPMIKGLSMALLGGLGSVQGAVIAAILLGFNEALTARYLGGQYVLITQFLLIIAVLLVHPRGIAGILDRAREA